MSNLIRGLPGIVVMHRLVAASALVLVVLVAAS
jgi:hypothetical protein